MQHRLKTARVRVLGPGRVGARLAEALAAVGVGAVSVAEPSSIDERTRPDGAGGAAPGEERPSLLVLCDDGFDPDCFDAVNRYCLEQRLPWTSYRDLGTRYEVGPLVVPFETACFACLEQRRRGNVPSYDERLAMRRALSAAGGSLGRLNLALGCDVLALEVVKALTRFSRPTTYGAVYSFDVASLEGTLHPVLKLPRCPACGHTARDRATVSFWDPAELLDDRAP
jgi:bacteriocin biosynthesis cyclodehydratase domain-containing protein